MKNETLSNFPAAIKKALEKPERPQNCGTGYCSCIECVMKPEQEPVAWMYEFWDDNFDAANGGVWRRNLTFLPLDLSNCRNVQPLYTTPPQRTAAVGEDTKAWVGLTDEELENILKTSSTYTWKAAELVEDKLKEKNNG